MPADGVLAAGLAWGLLHGLEPGHGWPLAVAWSARRGGGWALSAFAGALIGAAHLVSAVAVLVLWLLAASFAEGLLASPWVPIGAGLVLLVLAAIEVREWRRHAEEHVEGDWHATAGRATLRSLVVAAFVLGFAHEEEFALLAFCASGVSCTLFVGLYAAAVTLGLVVAVVAGTHLLSRMARAEHVMERILPLAAAAVLVALGAWQVAVGALRLAS